MPFSEWNDHYRGALHFLARGRARPGPGLIVWVSTTWRPVWSGPRRSSTASVGCAGLARPINFCDRLHDEPLADLTATTATGQSREQPRTAPMTTALVEPRPKERSSGATHPDAATPLRDPRQHADRTPARLLAAQHPWRPCSFSRFDAHGRRWLGRTQNEQQRLTAKTARSRGSTGIWPKGSRRRSTPSSRLIALRKRT